MTMLMCECLGGKILTMLVKCVGMLTFANRHETQSIIEAGYLVTQQNVGQI